MSFHRTHPTRGLPARGVRAPFLAAISLLVALGEPWSPLPVEAGEADAPARAPAKASSKGTGKGTRKSPASRAPAPQAAAGGEAASPDGSPGSPAGSPTGAAPGGDGAPGGSEAPRGGEPAAATPGTPEKFEIPVQPSPEVGASESAPASPRDPTAAQLAAAIAAAEKELAEVRAAAEAEAKDLGGVVARIAKDNAALRERQRNLEERFRKADADLQQKAAELEEKKKARTAAEGALDLTRSELEAQVATLEERFASSLAASEDPELLAGIRALEPGAASAASAAGAAADDATGKVRKLLGLYSKALDFARTASVLNARIQLPAQGGKLDLVEVLRLGLIGGYYAQTSGNEVGFVVASSEGDGGLKGEPRGVTSSQAAAIRSALADPAKGATLPFDVTGGQGLAAMQTSETFARWFEMGGFAMWPLLGVFLASWILVVERSVSLGLQSFGIRRRIDRVIALVRQGRMEEAEARCAKAGGAVGGVLHAALVHRDKDRSVMEDAVQEALLHWAPKFQTRLGFISLCAAVAPLLGLFGTVTGMITTFKMVTLFGTSDPRFLAGGISEALITTEAGLMIAIPALLMRGLLGSLADSALGKLETGALSLVLQLSRSEESLAEAQEAA